MGATWANVTDFPSVGTYAQDPSDSTGIGSDLMGIAWVTFDSNSNSSDGSGSSRIFVGVANMGSDNIFVSEDAGSTWSALAGQNSTFIPHHGEDRSASLIIKKLLKMSLKVFSRPPKTYCIFHTRTESAPGMGQQDTS